MRPEEALREKLDEKEKELKKKEAELKTAKEKVTEQQQQIQTKEKALAEAREQLKVKEEEQKQLKLRLTEKEDELKGKETELRSANRKIAEQLQLIQAKEEKIVEIQQQQLRQKEEIAKQQELIQTKDKKLAETQQQLRQKGILITAIIVLVVLLTISIAVLVQFYINHEAETNELKSNITALQRELNEAKLELGTKKDQLNVLKAKLKMEKTEIEEKERETNLTITELRRELNTTLTTIKELRSELNTTLMKLDTKEGQLKEIKTILEEKNAKEEQILMENVVNYSKVSGPGLKSATVNHPTHLLVETTDSNGRPLSLQLNVTAQLELVPKATPTNQPEATPTNQPTTTSLPVVMKSPSRYEVSYTAVSRGQHKLHVQVNDREINGSPYRVNVYPDPRQLDHPVITVTDLNGPYGIAFNNHEEMIVSECWGHRVYILDTRGNKIRTFGSEGDRPDQMNYPRGVATDDADNIYVSSEHKLQKFTSNGKLIKFIGQQGNKEGEFNVPRGITVYNNQLYVCDKYNHRIQVFDLDLNFVRSIGSHGRGRGEFYKPCDVKLDTAGNMYVTEYNNSRVQVLDSSGRFIRSFSQEEGKGKLSLPVGLHIADKYVYVSDHDSNCIVVYETSGQFVTLFGRYGSNDGEFSNPFCVTSDVDGFIYVCDFYNNRVQIF